MLKVNNLCGFGEATSYSPVISTFTDSGTSTASQSTYNFTSKSIGTATPDRYVVVMGMGDGTGGNGIQSLTIGGVSATIIDNGISGNNFAAMANITSGTTATITVVFVTGATRVGIAVYDVKNLIYPNTPTVTTLQETGTSSVISRTPTVQAGSLILANLRYDAQGTASTVTGLTENVDISIEATRRFYAASGVVTQAGPYTYTITIGTATGWTYSEYVLR